MKRNKLHGSWDQVKGFSGELWGEITGYEQTFSAGLRKCIIDRLESYCDMSRNDTEQKIDQLLQ